MQRSDTKTIVIAEAGVNHNGSIEMAKQLVEAAANAGADYIKFQTFCADKLVSKIAQKAEYQKEHTEAFETQHTMLKKLMLDEQAHLEIVEHCKKKNIKFISTPFDEESLMLLQQFEMPFIKVPSGEITNAPFLLKIGQTGKDVILSTGMSFLSEIETALSVLAFAYLNVGNVKPSKYDLQKAYLSEEGQRLLRNKVTLLHCTTEYPAPLEEVNLNVMETLKRTFGLPVGYSDHTKGISIPLAAVALGAVVIEKHFTINRELPGPDHKASLEPDELKQMVTCIREVETALGGYIKIPTKSEYKNLAVARKSLVAACDIKKGDIFTEDNLAVKRPGNGKQPLLYWEILGKASEIDYQKDDLI